MSRLSDLGAYGEVPSGADRDEVLDWALGRDQFRDGALAWGDFDKVLAAMSWHRLVATRNTWREDPLVLSRMVASMAAGLWQLGGVVGVVASSGPDGVDLRIGTMAADPGPPLATIQANMAGAVFTRDVGLPRCIWQPAGGLRPVIDAESDPSAPGLLDRLTALTQSAWRMSALLVPISEPSIHQHSLGLARLAAHLAGERSQQVQLTPQATSITEDPVVVRLAAAVEAEQQRTERAHRAGAFATIVSLSSPDAAQFAAAVGAATGAVPSASTGWRFTIPDPAYDALAVTALPTAELVDLLRPPLRDVLGLPSQRWERLDEHVEQVAVGGPRVALGQTEQGASVDLPIQLLSHHMLVTGATGSGKSSFLAQLLVRLAGAGVPFWVIEAVKDEWHSLPVPGLRRWAVGAPDPGQPWGLNPLEVPEGVAVATHVDYLVSLFRSSFGLPDPLPYLLELGLMRVYEAIGWDLGSDRLLGGPSDRADVDWPTLSDLLEVCMGLPSELRYDSQVQANLRAAMLARLGNLTRGPRGRLLDTTARFPMAEALQGHLVVNLDSIGDDNARSFVMGLLVVRLAEARRRAPSPVLDHVTIIEEAHRLMGQPSGSVTPGTSDPVGGTASMFGNLLSEIRASGEGLIIVDQSPKELVRAALVNTGTQVALRSKDRDDQGALGAAIGLPPEQERILSTLGVHESLVSWEGMDGPVRVRLDAVRLLAGSAARGSRMAARLSGPSRGIRQAAVVLARVGPADHSAARTVLLAAIDAEFRGIDPATKSELLSDAVGGEVRSIARARGWERSRREAATRAVLGGQYDECHPQRALLDGRKPHLACVVACPHGGCLVGEAVDAEAAAIRGEGAGTLMRLAADPEEARRRLRRRALAAIPATAPDELGRLALACVAVKVFDDWADPRTVGQLVRQIAHGEER